MPMGPHVIRLKRLVNALSHFAVLSWLQESLSAAAGCGMWVVAATTSSVMLIRPPNELRCSRLCMIERRLSLRRGLNIRPFGTHDRSDDRFNRLGYNPNVG